MKIYVIESIKSFIDVTHINKDTCKKSFFWLLYLRSTEYVNTLIIERFGIILIPEYLHSIKRMVKISGHSL